MINITELFNGEAVSTEQFIVQCYFSLQTGLLRGGERHAGTFMGP